MPIVNLYMHVLSKELSYLQTHTFELISEEKFVCSL